jgi:hypothetical protein
VVRAEVKRRGTEEGIQRPEDGEPKECEEGVPVIAWKSSSTVDQPSYMNCLERRVRRKAES